MRRRTQIILGLGAILAITGIGGEQCYRQFQERLAQHAVLLKKNATLRAAVRRLSTTEITETSESVRRSYTWVGTPPTDDAKIVPIRLDVIKQLGIPLYNAESQMRNPWDLTLEAEAIGLLAMSDEETRQVNAVLKELTNQIKSHVSADIRILTSPDPQIRQAFGDQQKTGKFTYYTVPPLDDNAVDRLTQWYTENLTQVLGVDRAEVFTGSAAERISWLQKNTQLIIGFRDFGTTTVPWTEVNYLIVNSNENQPGGTKRHMLGGWPLQFQSVPPELSFVFQPATNDPTQRRKIISP